MGSRCQVKVQKKKLQENPKECGALVPGRISPAASSPNASW
jgi:hypothetical protein